MLAQSLRRRAFTLVELVLVVAVLGLLATVLVQAQFDTQAKARAQRINCVSNLKQIGLAFRMWSNDHNDKFPMQKDAAKAGSREAIDKEETWLHFQIISNELSSPRILACHSDDRKPATNFLTLTATNISYFVGLDADEGKPPTILSGDRNVTNGIAPKKTVLALPDHAPAGWTEALHNNNGNIGLGDGSAHQVTTMLLRRQIAAANLSLQTNASRVQLPLAPAPAIP